MLIFCMSLCFGQAFANITAVIYIYSFNCRAYGVDGCILFSDILTPLPGMGVDFDIKVGSAEI